MTRPAVGAVLVCPDCGWPTRHPADIADRYCPRCHWWTSDPELGPARHVNAPEQIAQAAAFRIWRACHDLQPPWQRCVCPVGQCSVQQPG